MFECLAKNKKKKHSFVNWLKTQALWKFFFLLFALQISKYTLKGQLNSQAAWHTNTFHLHKKKTNLIRTNINISIYSIKTINSLSDFMLLFLVYSARFSLKFVQTFFKFWSQKTYDPGNDDEEQDTMGTSSEVRVIDRTYHPIN